MNFPIIDFKNDNIENFIQQWSTFYKYDKMELYTDNIDREVLEKEHLIQLYQWKNGTNLSKKKLESLENKILSKLDTINDFKQNLKIAKFLDEFDNVSFVWKIFLLHIVSPNQYPIYDQHIHRAFLFLNSDNQYRDIENTMSEKDKCRFYFKVYLPSVEELRKKYNFSIRDLDKALFTLGQFLKKYNVEVFQDPTV